MTEPITLDTTISEPSMTAGEVDMQLFALERSRATFAWKIGGLDAAALHRGIPSISITLAGLIKHVAWVEDWRVSNDLTGEPIGAPWNAIDFKTNPDWEFRSAADDSPEELYALWRDASERNRTAWREALSHGGLDQPSKRVYGPGMQPNLRRVLMDMHDEYARHLGHADLLREAVDGLVGEDPPQP